MSDIDIAIYVPYSRRLMPCLLRIQELPCIQDPVYQAAFFGFPSLPVSGAGGGSNLPALDAAGIGISDTLYFSSSLL